MWRRQDSGLPATLVKRTSGVYGDRYKLAPYALCTWVINPKSKFSHAAMLNPFSVMSSENVKSLFELLQFFLLAPLFAYTLQP